MARLGALAIGVIVGASWLGGCSGVSAGSSGSGAGDSGVLGLGGPALDTRALTTDPLPVDLDDFLPALDAILWKHGLAIERRLTDAEAWRGATGASLADGADADGAFVESVGYTLRDTRYRPGEIIARLDASGRVRIELRIGRFGDPQRERLVVSDVVARMTQLAGVDAAPIR